MSTPNNENQKKCRFWPVIFKVIGMVFLGVAFASCIALAFAALVMLLWNWLMPELFGLPALTYWQAAGLIILCKILFCSFGSCSSHSSKKEKIHKWMGCKSSEEDSETKDYKKFWHEKGKNCFNEYFDNFDKNKDKKE